MTRIFKEKKQVLILFWVSLFLASLACRVEAPKIILEEDTATPPIVVVTQVITERVTATAEPTLPSTIPPSATPAPTLSPTWDPANAPVWYPIEGCVASRLHIGDQAFVSRVGGPNGIRYGLDIFYDTVIAYAYPGDILDIIGGPWCSRGWIVWQVRTQDGLVGYTPEGNGNEYWLFPLPPQ